MTRKNNVSAQLTKAQQFNFNGSQCHHMLLLASTRLVKFNSDLSSCSLIANNNRAEISVNRILKWRIPDSRRGSAPRSSRADSHIVLLVDVLQKFDIDPLVSLLGISEIAKILSQEQVKTHTHT